LSLESFLEDDPTIREKIKQRRSQMLIHSCIYYELNENIVSDDKWQEWADELTTLQSKYPEYMKIGFYDEHFKDWDGSTGAHLPHRDLWVYHKSLSIIKGQE
jgi:hypothetical protein